MASQMPDTLLKTRLDAVYALAVPMSLMDLFGCALLAWLFWAPSAAIALGCWLVGCTGVVATRLAIVLAHRLRAPLPVKAWARLIAGSAGLSGLMWGGVLVWMLAVGNDNQATFVICVALSGLTLSIANIAYWPVYALFAAPVTLASAIGFALSHRPGGSVLAFGAAMMTIALLVTSKRLSRAVLRAHRLAETNQALIYSLAAAASSRRRAARSNRSAAPIR
jgi:hypothetical protein